MYRDSRVAWQREIYKHHFVPVTKGTDITGLIRILLLMLALTLAAIVFLPASLGNIGNDYLVLVEQHLPGMAEHVKNNPLSATETGLSLKNAYTRLLLGSMPPGFGSEEKMDEAALNVKGNLNPNPEHLIARNSLTSENPVAPAPEGTTLSLLAAPPVAEIDAGEQQLPRLLIYHTHTTESFLPVSGKAFTTDLKQSVVILGDYLAEMLDSEYGIPVLHHREIFDIPRSNAYAQARPVITKILEENPQIEVVVDLHRDGISREITTFSLNGNDTARILFVVGTRHEAWNSNLRFALFLQNILDEKYPGLCRGTRRQSFTYNQHVHPRSVLVEIGSHENKKEEVLRAVPYLAEVLAQAFY